MLKTLEIMLSHIQPICQNPSLSSTRGRKREEPGNKAVFYFVWSSLFVTRNGSCCFFSGSHGFSIWSKFGHLVRKQANAVILVQKSPWSEVLLHKKTNKPFCNKVQLFFSFFFSKIKPIESVFCSTLSHRSNVDLQMWRN